MQVVSLDFSGGCPSWVVSNPMVGYPLPPSPEASGEDLPSLFKHKVAFYLSRFCTVGFAQSLACHLYSQGMGITQIYELISAPSPSSLDELKEHVEILASRPSVVNTWPSQDSSVEKAIFWCSVYNYTHSGSVEVVSLLRRSLSTCLYRALSHLFYVIASTQKWVEFNPECAYPNT